jgi:putative SOS response-associated peptidase YedK
MCGRFTVQLTGGEIHDLYGVAQPTLPMELTPRYNGAPTQEFVACRLDESGRRVISRLRWGLVPSWADDAGIAARLINARAETVSARPAYRAAFRTRRCLIPASGWFEWQRAGRGKQPWFVALSDGSPVSFAALWERWGKAGDWLETFTIVTTEACESLADIHHRQPAIIHPDHIADWLDPASRPAQLLDMVREPCAGPFEKRPVSNRVNSVANNDVGILNPVRLPTSHDPEGPGLFD